MNEDPLSETQAPSCFDSEVVQRSENSAPTAALRLPSRYQALRFLGHGGMGEVWRVFDVQLQRTLAMKLVSRRIAARPEAVSRFIEEAQITAQLQHPGIVAIHDIGKSEDGRLFYTQGEIIGQRLDHFASALRAGTPGDSAGGGIGPWMTLMEIFAQICAIVGHAHARRVVHRDLKPSNIMVGAGQSVFVLDWGLAKVIRVAHEGSPDPTTPTSRPVETDRQRSSPYGTRHGAQVGTPGYMAPEQEAGDIAAITPRTDVFALGVMLHALLKGVVPDDAWRAERLLALAARCQAVDPHKRPGTATEVEQEVEGWLGQCRARIAAIGLVETADTIADEAQRLRASADAKHAEARRRLLAARSWDPEAVKAPAWALQEEAEALAQRAETRLAESLQTLRNALNHDAECPEAHQRLAKHYLGKHRQAERSGDRVTAASTEVLLRHHDRAGHHRAYLNGEGTLDLITEPPGATVQLLAMVNHHGRLITESRGVIGTTPIKGLPLPRGSYLTLLTKPGYDTVRYPILVERSRHWTLTPPGEADPAPIPLLPSGFLREDEVYVPGGWAYLGGDPKAGFPLPLKKRWVDGFIVGRHPVTVAEYLAFLNQLRAEGRDDEVQRWMVRERGNQRTGPGPAMFVVGGDDQLIAVVDEDGDRWHRSWPVVCVTWDSCLAYCRWRSSLDERELRWRLPPEAAWEKACRGVDRRIWPWGNVFDPCFAGVAGCREGPMRPFPVGSFATDQSVYGVMDLAGGVREWCSDAFFPSHLPAPGADLADATQRSMRGGHWFADEQASRGTTRIGARTTVRQSVGGFRIYTQLPPWEGST